MVVYYTTQLGLTNSSTGLQLSTYFSALKLIWLIQNEEPVRKAHESDDLLFGTVESWVLYVRPELPQLLCSDMYRKLIICL